MVVKPHRHLGAVAEPGGGWGVGGDTYSPDEFLTRSTDGHGHFRHLRVNVPPEVAGRVEAIVARQVIPAYRTSQDLIRDALVHRLHWLEQHIDDPSLARVLATERRKAALEQVQMEVEELKGLIDTASSSMQAAAANKDWWALAAALDMAEEHLDEIRDPYRTELQEAVRHFRVEYVHELSQRDDD